MASVPVPGTVHLVDLRSTSNRQHGDGSDIILIPQPTKDPNDPLNWSPMRRLTGSICHVLWVLFGAIVINGLTVAYLAIEEQTSITMTDLNLGNGLMYLFFGWGSLLSQPLALNFGRRVPAVVSFFITSFLILWSSFMKSSAEWYANRILIGIFFSGIESLIELCITDTKFTHERGLHMGMYNWSLYAGAFLSPIPAGFLASAVGWRWINLMYFIVGIVTTVFMFLFFEETMFYRSHTVYEFLDAEPNTATEETKATSSSTDDKRNDLAIATSHEFQPPSEETGEAYGVRPFVQRLKLTSARDPRQPNAFKFLLLPLQLMWYPSIFFSGILIGGVLAWFNVFTGTMALVFGNAPYNFSTNMIGLTYLACLIGASFGCFFAGWFSDRVAIFMARRNNGIKEPEARLWAALIPLVLHPAGCVLYGVGAAHGIHWVGLCFGLGLVTFGIVMGSTLALCYCVDCYKEIAGEAIVSIIVIRNSIGKPLGATALKKGTDYRGQGSLSDMRSLQW